MLGIITAMKEEAEAVLGLFQDVSENTFYGMKFYEGKIQGKSCVLAQSGVGKVHASRCTQLMIEKYSPSNIVNTGSAGALNPILNIGDIVIGIRCTQHDFDLRDLHYQKGCLYELSEIYIHADQGLVEKCKNVMEKVLQENNKYKVVLGAVASGDQFYNCPKIKQEIWKEFGADCDEMEGGAVAQVCYFSGVPFVVVRTITDKPAKRDELEFYNYLELAASRCALFVEELAKVI